MKGVILEATILRQRRNRFIIFLMTHPIAEPLQCLVSSCTSEKDEHKTNTTSFQVFSVLCNSGGPLKGSNFSFFPPETA